MKPQTIYFDESGYTGNNMLDPNQPSFVYASIAIDPINAADLISEMAKRFKLGDRELKGNSLVGYRRGQEAISWLLNECKGISIMAVSNKKFALAGKLLGGPHH